MPFTLDSKLNGGRSPSFLRRHPVLVPLAFFLLLLLSYGLVDRLFRTPVIGVVKIEGVVLDSESVIRRLRALEDAPHVRGIILRVNSPGGAVAPSQEIFSEIRRIREKKRVYTSIGSLAVSGGYYIAIGADRIFANPGSLVGNIGVIMQTFNIEGLLEKLGVRVENLKSGEYKDIASSFRNLTSTERKLLEAVLQDSHDQFITAVIENRAMDPTNTTELMDGRFFTGRQAVQNGLIDDLATFSETADRMRKDLGLPIGAGLYEPIGDKGNILSTFTAESLSRLRNQLVHYGIFYLSMP
jgi:protease IV